MPLTEQRSRKLLLRTWGEQACRNPAHWPDTLAALLRGRPHDERDFEDGHLKERAKFPRGSMLPWVNDATRALTVAFANGVPPDPADAVWRAFSKLDRTHCATLADRLVNAARADGSP
jgi:hypothetical protein